MPKRKHYDDDQHYIERKIRKLERKLKHARKRRQRTSESSCSSVRNSPQVSDQLVAEHFEDPTIVFNSDESGDNTTRLVDISGVTDPEPTSNNNKSFPEIDVSMPQLPDSEIDTDLLDILGKDLSSTIEAGPDIHSELATRLQYIATSGLDKETRKELSTKYLIPANCTKIAAPLMNDEIKAALPEPTMKRDRGLENRQKQVSSVISCLGNIISTQLEAKNRDNLLLKKLMDATRILCDVQYFDSMKRRYFASTTLKKEVNDHISKTKIDKYLFGENLAETLKSAKAVSRSGFEIRINQNNNRYSRRPANQQLQPSTSKNWKPPSTNRRPPSGPQRSRQPAAPLLPAPPPPPPPPTRAPPAVSSRTSRYQPRQSYRH